MPSVTFKGTPVQLSGQLPARNKTAPNFKLVNTNLEDVSLEKFGNNIKVLNIYLSLDTSVCATSVKKFQQYCANKNNVVVLDISMDLPFASGRFCKAENLSNVQTLSAFRSSFPKDYGVLIVNGPLAGLCARAVIVLDEHNKVIYEELVSEMTHEPSYDEAMKAMESVKK